MSYTTWKESSQASEIGRPTGLGTGSGPAGAFATCACSTSVRRRDGGRCTRGGPAPRAAAAHSRSTPRQSTTREGQRRELPLGGESGDLMVGARGIEPLNAVRANPAQDASAPDTCASMTSIGDGLECVKSRQGVGQPATVRQSKGRQTGDPELERLAVLWPKLSPGDRTAILALAASLGSKERA